MKTELKNEIYDAIVRAIRRDSTMGEGSCSVIDESYTDAELIESMKKKGIETITDAINHFIAIHRGYHAHQEDLEVAAHPTDPTPSERQASIYHAPTTPKEYLENLKDQAIGEGEMGEPMTVGGFIVHIENIITLMERNAR